jgi:hypothetical protein
MVLVYRPLWIGRSISSFVALSREVLSTTRLLLRELACISGNWIIGGGLKKNGYYFIGDSANALCQFIITPYDNAMHSTPKDNFNFSIHCQELLLNVPLEKLISAGAFCGSHCSFHWH